MIAAAVERVRLAERLRRDAFPDLWFTRSDQAGAFAADVRVETDALRLTLERPDFFHLGPLALHGVGADGAPRRVASARRVRLDGAEARGPGPIDHIFAEGYEWICFQSGNLAPELVVEFEPLHLRHIGIENRPDTCPERAWSLVIEARCADGRWRTLHRHARRERQFRATLRRVPAWPLDPSTAAALDRCATAAMRLDQEAREAVYGLGPCLGFDLAEAVRVAINQAILLPRRRELTTHGIQRSFRFWAAEEKRALLALLDGIHGALAAIGTPSFLGYGALLGFVREGDFIPHDDDADLVALVPGASDPARELARLGASLARAGYQTERGSEVHLRVHRPDGPGVVDLFLARDRGDEALFFPAREGLVPRSALLPLQRAPFLGCPVPLPANPFLLLERLYGEGWRRPDPAFDHDWSAAAAAAPAARRDAA